MANTFHVSVPEYMEDFIDQQVQEKHFKSKASYIQELIRQDKLRSEKAKLTNMLLTGLASDFNEMTSTRWNDLRAKIKNK